MNEPTAAHSAHPIVARQTYLNHAALAPLPAAVVRAMAEQLEESSQDGARPYRQWMARAERCRELAARLIGAASKDDLAFTANTSSGLSRLAFGLDWQPGDGVVLPAGEFPSNRLPWLAAGQRYELTVAEVPIEGASDPESLLIDALSSRTRLLVVSSVRYDSGLRLDLGRLGQACRERGVLFCVDAIQQLGALPLDVQAQSIDCLSASAHKWLLGPEGVALFYTSAELRGRLALDRHGWCMVDDRFRFQRDDWQPSESARRFEAGTANMLGITGLGASLEALEQEGHDAVARAVLERQAFLVEQFSSMKGLALRTDPRPQYASGIVNIEPLAIPAPRLFRKLQENGVETALRGIGIRLSPHYYTPESQLQETVRMVQRLLKD